MKTFVLAASLLLMLECGIAQTGSPPLKPTAATEPLPMTPVPASAAEQPGRLAGVATLSNLRVRRTPNGHYAAAFDYFYPGAPADAVLIVQATDHAPAPFGEVGTRDLPLPGKHQLELLVVRPPDLSSRSFTTKKVVATLSARGIPVAWTAVEFPIDWPDLDAYLRAGKSNDRLYDEAVAWINNGSELGLEQARQNLEQIVLKNDRHVPAHIELARYVMKTNWGPEGLRQAEGYLRSALAIDPQSANAKVLMGYVFAHQKRYGEADAQFREAAAAGTPNLWLWANWGELLAMQNKSEQAIEKYLAALSGSRPGNINDRARLDAFAHVLPLLDKKKSHAQMDELHRRRVGEFGDTPCFLAEYGYFRLTRFQDYQGGIRQAKAAIDQGCTEVTSRSTLGLSYYYAWSTTSSGEEKTRALTQARVFLPEGPSLFYQLARTESTAGIISALVKTGVSLELRDNSKLNAMAYALMSEDEGAAGRLARLGSGFDVHVGATNYPVALIPLMRQSVRMVRFMKEAGVDFSKIRFNGRSAVDWAKETGNEEFIDLVSRSKKTPA